MLHELTTHDAVERSEDACKANFGRGPGQLWG